MDQYVEETYTQRYKVCPLTGFAAYDFRCDRLDCSSITPRKYDFYKGRPVHCEMEKIHIDEQIKKELDRESKKERQIQNMAESLYAVRSIDVDRFYYMCSKVDLKMQEIKQAWNEDMIIRPYHSEDGVCLIYMFKDGVVDEISMTTNPFSFIGTRFEKLRSQENTWEVSCHEIPTDLAEAIVVRLCLAHNRDVKSVLHDTNPVFIKERNVGKYIEAAYGWKWADLKKSQAILGITEFRNYDNIILVKQELDEIIRRGQV